MPRLRGCLWLTAGLVVAVLAGAVALLTLRGAMERQAGTGAAAGPAGLTVVVAARPVAVGAQLVAEDLTTAEMPAAVIPAGALRDPKEAIGKVTRVALVPGEIVLTERLVDPNVISGDGRTALLLAEDQVLMAYPIADLMGRIGVLKPGDHVDLLFSLQFPVEGEAGGGSEQVSFDLLQNVTIAAIVAQAEGQGGVPQALLLTVKPQDALLLKHAKDNGGILDIVLRPPQTEGPYELEPVDLEYMMDLYQILPERRR